MLHDPKSKFDAHDAGNRITEATRKAVIEMILAAHKSGVSVRGDDAGGYALTGAMMACACAVIACSEPKNHRKAMRRLADYAITTALTIQKSN